MRRDDQSDRAVALRDVVGLGEVDVAHGFDRASAEPRRISTCACSFDASHDTSATQVVGAPRARVVDAADGCGIAIDGDARELWIARVGLDHDQVGGERVQHPCSNPGSNQSVIQRFVPTRAGR